MAGGIANLIGKVKYRKTKRRLHQPWESLAAAAVFVVMDKFLPPSWQLKVIDAGCIDAQYLLVKRQEPQNAWSSKWQVLIYWVLTVLRTKHSIKTAELNLFQLVV